MKRILVFSLLSCTLLVACTPTGGRNRRTAAPFPRNPDIYAPEAYPGGPVEVLPDGTQVMPTPAPTPEIKPMPTPVAVAPTQMKRETRYGIPEPGKPGFMRSPYTPSAGLIDYRGLPPGTEVRDPYTQGKIILTP